MARYDDLFASDPTVREYDLCVRFISPSIGVGVFTRRNIAARETIFIERPIAAMQHVHNRTLIRACATCSRAIGSVREQWQRILDALFADRKLTAPEPPMFDTRRYDTERVTCERCDEEYCSRQCAHRARQLAHATTCTEARIPTSAARTAAWNAFRLHAVAHNETFLLAADVFARIIQTLDGTINNDAVDAAAMRFIRFVHGLWWEQADADAHRMHDETDGDVRCRLRRTCEHAHALLTSALRESVADDVFQALTVTRLLDVDTFSSVVSVFDMNNIAFFAAAPLATFAAKTQTLDDDALRQVKRLLTLPLYKTLDTARDVRVEGTALFNVASSMNHSCDPNVIICKRDNVNEEDGFIDLDDTMCATAIRDIAAGDELRISYIEQKQSKSERQSDLRSYQFTCQCARCDRQGNDDDNDDDDDDNDEQEDDEREDDERDDDECKSD